MAKDEIRLKKVLEDMSYALNHIEDIVADNREVIIKLVKQSNKIVEFLKQIEIEEINVEDKLGLEDLQTESKVDVKYSSIKELVDEFMSKQKDLRELEKELKKYKDDITPGQIGEA